MAGWTGGTADAPPAVSLHGPLCRQAIATFPPEHQADLVWDLGWGVATPALPCQTVRAAVEYLNM